MSKEKKEPFSDVEFKTEHPVREVAEHEVLMSFTNDDDATKFHEWWHHEGAIAFNAYIKGQQA